MSAAEKLITDNLDIWASAIKSKSSAGRGTSKKIELYGIKKLRELILELAVRGLLVPQDPKDEPASELLKKIASEKSKLIKEGKIKKQKPLPPIKDEEKPFELPKGWVWARLNDAFDVRDGTHDTPKYYVTGYPLVTSKNLSTGRLDMTDIKFISGSDHKKIIERSKVDKEDILFAMIGSIGNPVLVDIDPNFSIKNVALFKYYNRKLSCPSFLLRFLCFAEVKIKAEASGAVQSFASLGTIRGFVIGIPPLSEQHRIVAKVDELMALCDKLENQQEESIDAHETLVEVLLAALTNASQKGEFATAWKRIAENFDVLFTTENSVNQLKQTILQLAVMGKLVPQDPKDEPASELLKKIAAEKAKLVKEGKIKKQKPLPEIKDEEKPFEIPKGWEWCRISDLTTQIGSGSTPRGGEEAYINSGIPFLRSQNIWNDGLKLDDVVYISDETHAKMGNTQVFPGDILLNITGASLGRSIIFPSKIMTANVSQHVTIIRLVNEDLRRFVHMGIISPLVQKLVWTRQVGMAIGGLSKKVLEQFEFPVPPIEEQHRIVAKVDELMALCDSLKEKISSNQTTQLQIADCLAGRVVA